MNVLVTDRLALRQLTADDAGFVLGLVNDPAWLRFIGDRGIRTLDDARAYVLNGPVASYAKRGFGLWLALRRTDGVPVGICGLLQRESLPDVEVGFALLPPFRAQGYAFEVAAATLAHGRDALRLPRIAAVCSPDNEASIRLLEKLGLHYEKMVQLSPTAPAIKLFAVNF